MHLAQYRCRHTIEMRASRILPAHVHSRADGVGLYNGKELFGRGEIFWLVLAEQRGDRHHRCTLQGCYCDRTETHRAARLVAQLGQLHLHDAAVWQCREVAVRAGAWRKAREHAAWAALTRVSGPLYFPLHSIRSPSRLQPALDIALVLACKALHSSMQVRAALPLFRLIRHGSATRVRQRALR
jgi:hypothetical protein